MQSKPIFALALAVFLLATASAGYAQQQAWETEAARQTQSLQSGTPTAADIQAALAYAKHIKENAVGVTDSTVQSNMIQTATSLEGAAEAATARLEASAASNEESYYGFSVGFATIFYKKGRPRIESAIVTDGKVRITDERAHESRLVFEAHILNKSRWGGFAALLVDGDKKLTGMGFGFMKQFSSQLSNAPNKPQGEKKYLNFGIGWVHENKVKELGIGMGDNEPLPSGETEVRFREASRTSPFILISTTF